METPASIIESLFERVEAYSMTTLELSKLKVLETTTVIVSSLVSHVSVIFSVVLFVLVLNIGIAFWLGELLGKTYYGFFIVAAFYLLVSIILYLFLYKWIKKPLSDMIIVQALQ
jgi:lipoprotein signal peptidase